MSSAPAKTAAEPGEQYGMFSVPYSTSFTTVCGSTAPTPFSVVTGGSEGGHVPSVFGSKGGHVPSVFVQPLRSTVPNTGHLTGVGPCDPGFDEQFSGLGAGESKPYQYLGAGTKKPCQYTSISTTDCVLGAGEAKPSQLIGAGTKKPCQYTSNSTTDFLIGARESKPSQCLAAGTKKPCQYTSNSNNDAVPITLPLRERSQGEQVPSRAVPPRSMFSAKWRRWAEFKRKLSLP